MNDLLKHAKRALAALETPDDLTADERGHVIEDLGAAIQGAEIPRRFDFISDPGHGWLKIARADVDALGIAPQISTCSYQDRAGFAYLEEDCDFSVFMRAAEAAGWSVSLNELHQEHCHIRDLPIFRA